jgi:Domain of unknown function (DUF397)
MEAMTDPRWRKSSYSDNGGNCAEVADDTHCVLVRDTKDHGQGPVLRVAPAAWRRFTGQMKKTTA